MNNPFSILIVGGGVSSLLACQQLFTIKNFSCSIRIIHSNSNFPKGIAYSPKSDRLLLNVPAGKMSLKLDEPNHFVEWLSKQEDISLEISQLSEEFVPRLVYGNYIEFVWENLLQQVDKSIHTLEIICDEVVGLTKNNSSEYQRAEIRSWPHRQSP